jgi:hypothetical protein
MRKCAGHSQVFKALSVYTWLSIKMMLLASLNVLHVTEYQDDATGIPQHFTRDWVSRWCYWHPSTFYTWLSIKMMLLAFLTVLHVTEYQDDATGIPQRFTRDWASRWCYWYPSTFYLRTHIFRYFNMKPVKCLKKMCIVSIIWVGLQSILIE